MQSKVKTPTLQDALLPLVALIVLLILSVYLFGDNSSQGANQIALLIATVITSLVAIKNGYSWKEIEASIVNGISISIGAIMILLSVGTLIGCWILSGTVPAMIYYGLKLLEPGWFYAASCIVSTLVALSIGGSWITAGTIGVGLIGTAAGLGLSLEITAGAIISGAYFGDKMSPLSDTTNLAPAVAGSDLFSHIRHMTWTTAPSIVLAVIGFLVIGYNATPTSDESQMAIMLQLLAEHFDISPLLLIPLAVVVVLAWRKTPALPSLLAGVAAGALVAVIFQRDAVIDFAGGENMGTAIMLSKGLWMALADGYQANTGNEALDSLLSRGGMSSMLVTIWLIMTAMAFGAVMEKSGFLARLIRGVMGLTRSAGGLIATTILTSIGTNIVTADQYIAIVVPGRMYKLEFERRGLAMKNLSRALEDSGTITSPLVPWNTCGAFMAGTLGVATFAYLPYCFFNLVCPIISMIYGFLNFKITPLDTPAP